MEHRVYEPCNRPCDHCKTGKVLYLPVCKHPDDGHLFTYAVCQECRDKVPFEVVPVTTYMDSGFYYCPETQKMVRAPSLDPDIFVSRRGILTRYGKKLKENNNEHA